MIASKILMLVCAINLVLAVYTGFFIPIEYHSTFMLEIKDYFVLSFVGFCTALMVYLKERKDNDVR